jgi:hypothetical protein
MLIWGNSFHNQWNPGQGAIPMPMGSAWGNPSQSPPNVMHAQPSTSYFGNQSIMSPQMKIRTLVMAMVFTRTLASNLVPFKLHAPFSMVIINNNQNYLSWQHYIYLT